MDYHSALNFQLLNFISISVSETTILLVSIIILYFFSFLLSGSEVAFFALTSKDINILKTRKQPSYKRIVSLLEQPKILMATMLIANSFVNIGIILISNLLINSWFKGDFFNSVLLSFSLKVVIVSSFMVLFAEVLPKVWATHHKVWFASTASLIVEIFNSLIYRISKRFVGYAENIEKRFSSFHLSEEDEENNIDNAIDLLPENEAGIEEKQILKGIRKFGAISVKQVMRTRLDVSGIDYNVNINEIKKQAEDLHYSRLPVYKSSLDEIVGVLHMKDLLPFLNNEEGFDWRPLMRAPYFVHEQKSIEDLLQEFKNKRTHFAVVVDEFGGTSGIVTLEDILEEIIGDIKDEFDDEESVNKKIDDYNYIFEGKTMINDACKAMKLPISAFDNIRGDSDSLAGLLLEIAGEFPKVDEEFESGEYKFICLEINKNRIDKVKVIIQPKENEE